ncbi:MAG: NAD(P)/FAD-dependent oxidoreductase [Myxococcales bacterium]|nr:NAD(P)/FAD-dependent oxidoreductase [Myxococcales bacterium]
MARPRVVIVGGGFGGLQTAKALADAPVDVTLVDRTNHHLFQPLLYQVATSGLSPADIASPIRAVLAKQRNVEVLLAEVTDIDLDGKRLETRQGPLDFDMLVLAAGARTNYFGHDEWARNAPGLKDVDDALEIRRKILLAFEAAERESDAALRRQLLTFVVVGGGPTGVELAGAIAELSRHALLKDFRRIDPAAAKVLLLEGGERILSSFSPALSEAATRGLERLGVEVRTSTFVTRVGDGEIYLGEQRVATTTVLWAAGVAGSPLGRKLGVPLDRGGRVIVGEDCSVPGHPDVFVIGDLACFTHDPQTEGAALAGVAQVALQQGAYVGALIGARLDGQQKDGFRYRDKGQMATIGRRSAVVQTKRLAVTGLFAWMMWLFIHVLFLIGFRNRASVLFNWTWQYYSFQRGARLITGHRLEALPRGTEQQVVEHNSEPRLDADWSRPSREAAERARVRRS